MTNPTSAETISYPPNERTILGHPAGLFVLFFTELWERFSFYGMKALLLLYLRNQLRWTQEDGSELMAWYTYGVYAMCIVGGLVADRVLGAWWTVLLGGVLLTVGHILMAFEALPFLFTALGFIVLGVGLLKPNISTQVASLYPPADPRRDSGFTIFYMGINVGAFLGAVVCGWLQINYGFHVGFAAAGIGMAMGLFVYATWRRHVMTAYNVASPLSRSRSAATDDTPPDVTRDRVKVLVTVFVFVILFWMSFEQSSNVVTIWADQNTNLRPFRAEPRPPVIDESAAAAPANDAFEVAASQTHSINSFFVIALAPVFALLWGWLQKRGKQPSTPTKMALGITLVGAAFVPLIVAAQIENGPTSTALQSVPAGVNLSKYGATRLKHDPASATLSMHGVLPNLDRLDLLASAAPESLAVASEQLMAESIKRAADANAGDVWRVTAVVSDAIERVRLPAQPSKLVAWDEATRTLSTSAKLDKRARLEVLAAAADPAFRSAVNDIYLKSAANRVSIWWIVVFYLIATFGELCLSPVGLSLVTKLAPPRFVGLMMGGWFLATAVANWLAHTIARRWGQMPPDRYFMIFAVAGLCGGALLLLFVRPLKRMMHGVK